MGEDWASCALAGPQTPVQQQDLKETLWNRAQV